MDVCDILDRLVAFPSVAGRPNNDIVSWIETYLREYGANVRLVPGPEGDRSNLFATIGPADVPGYVLSGHMDVVPAGEPQWSSDPFALRREGERLYGRGTTDMKGFLAAALAALPVLMRLRLARPIHLAFSYDEEVGCRGVPHLIARLPELCAKPLGVIVGEPSGMRAVRGHKGKAAARVTIRGRSGHSSRPDLGLNAIHAMADVLSTAVSEAGGLMHGPFDAAFEPPYSSLQAGVIAGGQSVNIIPDTCTLDLEARAIPGVDPTSLLTPVRASAETRAMDGFRVEWTPLSAYPALSLPQDAPLAALLQELTGQTPLAAVSYGTEAGLYQAAGLDAIICGPGDIGRAHKPDEYILESELAACQQMIEALGARCAA
ncbi:acetylornithine deacetylase [Mesorhizobium sp. CA18]|uniref:acetylornithine deacetylase n=1 Tax=unclassified Mesorhizobium TaxID=325217 RepID=UPI001CCE5962|nr:MULTISPECIES: acetylornithine deacetylase [unclassified Mesorhizobium]MBZ9737395.1 acetylornithine deacetylase [Mesorhizobium sp. CA9]MBZ9828902.1 acetylornithine deacetylase [Mesorhizobium sp. CA18]MBZ9835005.1 acetylornithine deacetylase [Mesorhizobium sp. CA2]MBZ9840677.1 acetylornithine deacetylase [Mesorhizobium sp. CA3]MBZ9880129.1 acetylornithine deacetylase [Mesorhizobium sp. Ca11]